MAQARVLAHKARVNNRAGIPPRPSTGPRRAITPGLFLHRSQSRDLPDRISAGDTLCRALLDFSPARLQRGLQLSFVSTESHQVLVIWGRLHLARRLAQLLGIRFPRPPPVSETEFHVETAAAKHKPGSSPSVA